MQSLLYNRSRITLFNEAVQFILSALEASKAFDRVNHSKLFDKLVARNMPNCILRVLINWYGKLQSLVRWNGVFSSSFTVTCGARQGGVLSPFLFNIYVDQLIDDICSKNIGCYVNKGFFGCIMYADDLILLSPFVIGLQHMLNVCYKFGSDNDIVFARKCSNSWINIVLDWSC